MDLNTEHLFLIIQTIAGQRVNIEKAAEQLFEHTKTMLETHYPKIVLLDYVHTNLLLLLFKESENKNQSESIAKELGSQFSEQLKQKYQHVVPKAMIAGLESLKTQLPDNIQFLTINCHVTENYCQFLAYFWTAYLNQFLPIKFASSRPVCKKVTENLDKCLFSFVPILNLDGAILKS